MGETSKPQKPVRTRDRNWGAGREERKSRADLPLIFSPIGSQICPQDIAHAHIGTQPISRTSFKGIHPASSHKLSYPTARHPILLKHRRKGLTLLSPLTLLSSQVPLWLQQSYSFASNNNSILKGAHQSGKVFQRPHLYPEAMSLHPPQNLPLQPGKQTSNSMLGYHITTPWVGSATSRSSCCLGTMEEVRFQLIPTRWSAICPPEGETPPPTPQ